MNTKKAIRQLRILGKKPREMRLAAEQWGNNFEILISTILSARTRDEVTIPNSERLFKKYPNAKRLSKARLKDVEKTIKQINFYKTKSKNIISCSKDIAEMHDGRVPLNFGELVKLKGVGRKTANVFLSEIGKDTIAVDTHVSYISQKLGWTRNSRPEKIEKDLGKLFPRKYWKKVNPVLVRFGKTHTSKRKKDELLKEIRKIR